MKITIQIWRDDNIRLFNEVIYCDPSPMLMDQFWKYINNAIKFLKHTSK